MPPVVVSGFPNITPIFCRSWLVNTIAVFVCLIAPDSFRSAWLISRACIPIVASPMSPSISARGTSAATLSTTTTSAPPALGRIPRVQRMFHVDVGARPAQLLRFRHDVLAQRRLARRLRPKDLRHPSPRHAPHPQRQVQRQRPGRDRLHRQVRRLPPPHHRPVAVLPL